MDTFIPQTVIKSAEVNGNFLDIDEVIAQDQNQNWVSLNWDTGWGWYGTPDFENGYQGVEIMKDAEGWVHLRGLFGFPSNDNTLCGDALVVQHQVPTIAAGYTEDLLPAKRELLIIKAVTCLININGIYDIKESWCRCDIVPTGSGYAEIQIAAPTGRYAIWASYSGIKWKAA